MVTPGFVTFAAISGAGWAVDVVGTMALVQIGLSPFVASICGSGVAVTCVYVVSRFVLFSNQRLGTPQQYLLYVVWQIAAIAAASLLVSWIAFASAPAVGGLSVILGMDALTMAVGAGKILVTPVTLCANFAFMTWLTRGDRPTRVTGGAP